MQTFLPYHDFKESAKVLDFKRLAKQRVETLQILKALKDPSYGWQNHPAVKMWRGCEGSLVGYGIVICDQYLTNAVIRETVKEQLLVIGIEPSYTVPSHFDEAFHESHRSQLYYKFPSHYKKFFGEGLKRLEYVWPVK